MKREDIIKMMEGDEFAWVTQGKTLIDIATTPNEISEAMDALPGGEYRQVTADAVMGWGYEDMAKFARSTDRIYANEDASFILLFAERNEL